MDEKNNMDIDITAYEEIEKLISSLKLYVADKKIDKLLDKHSDDLYLLFFKARIYYHKGDLDKAKSILESIVTEAPDFFSALNNLCVVYCELGEYDSALKLLEDTVSSTSYDYDVVRNLADLYLNLERYEDAILIYKGIIKEYPDDIEVLKILAQFSKDAEYYDDALIYIEHALKFAPDDAELKNEREYLLNRRQT
jgi:tetratricopeptide (TPR) repeat protein